MFKKGDKVRCLRSSQDGTFTEDNIYTVREDQEFDCNVRVEADNKGRRNGWIPNYFELVKTSNDLQVLVETANKGFLAWQEICDRYGKESCVPASGNTLPEKYINLIEIKPKPKFEEFMVGDSWIVKLEGDDLWIGCKCFNAFDLRTSLVALTKDNTPTWTVGNFILNATRTGIKCVGYGEISWDEADRILEALVKAGV